MSSLNEYTQLQQIIEAVQQGTATLDEQGIILKAAQAHMSSVIVSMISDIHSTVLSLNPIIQRLTDKYTELTNNALDADIISREDVFNDLQSLQSKQLQIIDLYRKIVQSPNKLFADSDFSEDEKKVIRLLKSFKTAQEKQEFLKLCEEHLTPKVESFE